MQPIIRCLEPLSDKFETKSEQYRPAIALRMSDHTARDAYLFSFQLPELSQRSEVLSS
jgi:hypothetical protein